MPVPSGRGAILGDFIPYTDKPLSWHTDGYYNAPDEQVGAWCLFCARAARDGGENGLIDHEMAYLQLRDESPQHIAALSHPQALSIPAHVHGRPDAPRRECRTRVLGPQRTSAHALLGARTQCPLARHARDTRRASGAGSVVFAPGCLHVQYRLKPGKGMVSNNVFTAAPDSTTTTTRRRRACSIGIRFLDRIADRLRSAGLAGDRPAACRDRPFVDRPRNTSDNDRDAHGVADTGRSGSTSPTTREQ
jgi:hypothetical protein